MAHELARLRSKLFNTPFLIDSKSFESIMTYLDTRCEGDIVANKEAASEYSMYSTLYYDESNLGVIHINGPLTDKSTGWEAICGGTSYESIKEDFESLLEDGAKTVAFMVSSGGGEAYNMMDTGRYLRKLADTNQVKIISYVDGLSASAAYGLTAISDEIISHSESELGSIGVLIRLINDSKALEMKGYERTFITAGGEKIPFADDGSFRKEFLEDLQYKVDVLYKEFTEYVAENRGISVETVRNTQAKTFLAEDAIALGLADKTMTPEEFYAYLSSEAQNNTNGNSMKDRIFKFTKNEETQNMTQLAQLQEQLETMQVELSTAQASVAELATLKETHQALLANFESQSIALSEALENVAKMEQEKEKSKADLRKEKLSAAGLSADEAEAMQASLAVLEDDAFSSVLFVLSAQKKILESSDLMIEMGGESPEEQQPDNGDEKQLSTTQKLILQRLGKSQN